MFESPWVRGITFAVGGLLWLASLFFMGLLDSAAYRYALLPQEYNYALLGWIFYGPAVPIGLAASAGNLYLGRRHFWHVAPRLATLAWTSLPAVLFTYAVGAYITTVQFQPGAVVPYAVWFAMTLAVLFHVVMFGTLVLMVFRHERLPWSPPESDD